MTPSCDMGRCEPTSDRRACIYCGKELVPGPDQGCAFTWDWQDHRRPVCQAHDSTECTPPRQVEE